MNKLRILIVVMWLPVIITAFVVRLQREIRLAFWLAWNDAMMEHEAMRRDWNTKEIKSGDQE